MNRISFLMLGAVAFALPHGAMGNDRNDLAMVGGCGDPGLSVTISFDRPQGPEPADHPCCDRLACHAVTERSKKPKRA